MFTSLRVNQKFMIVIFAFLVSSLLAGVVTFTKLTSITGDTERIGGVLMPATAVAGKLRNSVDTYRRSELQYYLNNTDEEMKRYADRMVKMREEVKDMRESLAKMPLSAEARKQLADFDAAWSAYAPTAAKVYDMIRGGDSNGAQKLTRGEGKKLYDKTNQILMDLQAYSQKEADSAIGHVNQATQSTKIWMVVMMLAGLTISTILAWLASNAIAKPLQKLAQNAEQVASGDLRVNIELDSKDEVGQLGASFERMINSLREMIGTLTDTSAQISQSSSVMSIDAAKMSSGAEDVASQAITVATASEEMSTTSGDIAQNCQMAAESAKRANEAAAHGASVVEESISVMRRIAAKVQSTAATVDTLGQRSDEIGVIVGTIEDIADQTNLLALNAAIEAARAGEQGRGFAVVADEVRALAERTTRATREIGQMIKAIQLDTKSAVSAMDEGVAEVEQGTTEAARSGEALLRIQEEINAVTMQVHQIATAAEEQTATTSEISSSIQQITTIAGDTVESSRNTASSSSLLSRLSEELQKLVGQFKLSEDGKLINWSRSYSVGVSRMDDEHKRLIDIINSLYAAMRAGRSNEAIGSILNELVEYTKTHFNHEEKLMQECKYEGYPQQKAAHEALIRQVVEIQGKYKDGTALGQEVMNFLRDWLIKHIQGMDSQYGKTMNKCGYK